MTPKQDKSHSAKVPYKPRSNGHNSSNRSRLQTASLNSDVVAMGPSGLNDERVGIGMGRINSLNSGGGGR